LDVEITIDDCMRPDCLIVAVVTDLVRERVTRPPYSRRYLLGRDTAEPAARLKKKRNKEKVRGTTERERENKKIS
jgi:hypothetical protein